MFFQSFPLTTGLEDWKEKCCIAFFMIGRILRWSSRSPAPAKSSGLWIWWVLGEPDLIRWDLNETRLFLKSAIQRVKRIPCEGVALLLPLQMKGVMWQGGWVVSRRWEWQLAHSQQENQGLSVMTSNWILPQPQELGGGPELQIRTWPSQHCLRLEQKIQSCWTRIVLK